MLNNILIPVAAAFVAAAMNAIAGGGSFVLFPVLTGITGLSAKLANITCTIGLWPGYAGSVVAAWDDFRDLDASVIIGYCIVGLIGGAAGAWLLLHTSSAAFLQLVPWLLLFASVVFALGPTVARWAARGNQGGPKQPRFSWRVLPLLLVISIYNGYFGAGGGVLLLAGFGLAGLSDIKQMQALKTLIQITANAAAIVLFIHATFDPRLCAWMGIASFGGGFVAMAGARRIPAWMLRAVILIIAFGLTAVYFAKVYG